jgi:hypothetical protein
MIKLLYNLFGKSLLRYHFSLEARPLGFEDLSKQFQLEYKGKHHNYYSFGDSLGFSVDRLGYYRQFTIQMFSGLTGSELIACTEFLQQKATEATTLQKDPKALGKALAQITAITVEMQNRQEMVVPQELVYNYLAVHYVREDENPMVFSQDIHLEKVEAFKASAERQDKFFFQLPELIDLKGFWNITTENWTQYIQASTLQAEKLKILLGICSERSELEKTSTISTK